MMVSDRDGDWDDRVCSRVMQSERHARVLRTLLEAAFAPRVEEGAALHVLDVRLHNDGLHLWSQLGAQALHGLCGLMVT